MKYEIREIPNGLLVFAEGRCLAGVGSNYYRPWLYPLYTLDGFCVLQEFPFDHPFHNGCFVGQNPVRLGGREANFWAVPPQREAGDALFAHVGRVQAKLSSATPGSSAVISLQNIWRDERGEPVLDEQRSYEVFLEDNATVCEVTSRKIAAYGELEFPASKFGGIAVRVDPRLLPVAGGRILGQHESPSRFVAYENPAAGFGVRLVASDPAVPWLVRDYGLAVYNPTWQRPLRVARGEAWELSMRVLAYTIRA
jgi:Methane oxygenase PmoA